MSKVIPANLVLYLREEINAMTTYKRQLEQTDIPPDYLQVEVEDYRMLKQRLEQNVERIYNDITAIVKKHLSWIEVDANPEITIANILSVLPAPEEVVVKKVYHGIHGPANG
jgi:hypothetical protein